MKYLLPILFIVTLSACKPAIKKEESKSPYFEGFVESKVSYKSANSSFVAGWKSNFGVKEITYVGRDGFFCREYIDSSNIILARDIYRPDSLRFFTVPANGDTIYSSDVTRNVPHTVYLGMKNDSSFKILNHVVQAVKVKTSFVTQNGQAPFYVYTTYYNDVNYKLHPFAYKRAALGDVDELFSHSPYVTTGTMMEYSNGLTITNIATRIVPSSIPGWHFEIPKNKVIVYN